MSQQKARGVKAARAPTKHVDNPKDNSDVILKAYSDNSKKDPYGADEENPHVDLPFATVIYVYITYASMMFLAYVNEYLYQFRAAFMGARNHHFSTSKGYAPLLRDFDYFWTRHLYGVIRDCFERPIASGPGDEVELVERIGVNRNETFVYTGKTIRCLNLGSYNYLGFGADRENLTTPGVLAVFDKYGASTCTTRLEYGTTDVHRKLERKVAKFLGKEDAIVFGMGYSTNSTTLPSLIGKGGLIISDSLNHASLVIGCRSSGAKISIFKHNDPASLEKVLRNAIAEGQPRTHRPWTKILVLVEGIYSMEGEVLRLKEILAVTKKYKAYLYVDEAHSIGALGQHARGICDYAGVDPKEVDVLMGTFTKSFAAVGGYICASKELISLLRSSSYGSVYDTSMSAPCAHQIIETTRIMMKTDEGKRRIKALRENSIYFRRRLKEVGFYVLGKTDSPVIPFLIGHPPRISLLSRYALAEKLALVVVGYPATPLIASRARVCVSASHSKEQIDQAIEILEKCGKKCRLLFGKGDRF